MKGIEIARKFYEEHGKEMLHSKFQHIEDKIAVGLVGSGSECFGFDDEISKDHDFEPGFCIFLPNENIVDRRTAFMLEREYYKLPREFEGLKRSIINPVGGNRHGVIRTEDFYISKIGKSDGELSVYEWLNIPDNYLAEATNGEIFFDNYGEFTSIRERISSQPESIRLKKLAGNLLIMAQSGQYNYARCISHGESGAAQLAVIEFSKAAMKAVFLLNRKYMPFYKWSFRAMRALPILPQLADTLEYLISSENDAQTAETKQLVIEDIASLIIEQLKEQNITSAVCNDLEKHAYSLNDLITDSEIRNMSIFAAV